MWIEVPKDVILYFLLGAKAEDSSFSVYCELNN